MYGVSFGGDGSDVELTVLMAQNNQRNKNHCIVHSNREIYVNYNSRNKKFIMQLWIMLYDITKRIFQHNLKFLKT